MLRIVTKTVFSVVLGLVLTTLPQDVLAQDSLEEQHTLSFQDAEITLADPGMTALLSVDQPRFRDVGRFRQMQANIRNISDSTLNLESQTIWMDADGFQVDHNPGWQVMILSPNESEFLQSTGKDALARAVRITIRLARQ